jgi:L-lactate dehydrogenase complex protein LldG
MARAQSIGAEVLTTRSRDLIDVLYRNLGPLAVRGIGVGSGLRESLPGIDAMIQSGDEWPAIAITRGAFGIAATGSVVLADRSHDDRLLALLCRRHIVLVAPVIVATLADAVPRLREWIATGERPYVSFVTGPSRTSDIERVLTIGVHGPAELVVVLVEDWEDTDA